MYQTISGPYPQVKVGDMPGSGMLHILTCVFDDSNALTDLIQTLHTCI